MKKFFCLILVLLMTLAACGAKPAAEQGIEGTPEEIIGKIYENHAGVAFKLMNMALDLSDGNAVSYNLGLSSGEKLAAAAISEPLQGQAYSLAVVRVKDSADAAAIAREIYDKVDMRKWICMEADTKTAAFFGDVVMFFMVNSEYSDMATAESMAEAFGKVCGGKAVTIG